MRFAQRHSKEADSIRRASKHNKTISQNSWVFDPYTVREWFASDPAACVSHPAAQQILRTHEHPFRPWIKFPADEEKRLLNGAWEKALQIHFEEQAARGQRQLRAAQKKGRSAQETWVTTEVKKKALVAAQFLKADQHTPWWMSLRNHLSGILPVAVVDRFADYLAGFLLVQENETPRSQADQRNRKRTNHERRQLNRLLQALSGSKYVRQSMYPASANPPRREALKTRLIRLMFEELVDLGYVRKTIASKYLPQVWDSIGEQIRASSFLRVERRSRQRTPMNKGLPKR